MNFSLINRRIAWRLTWLGWLCLLSTALGLLSLWVLRGETFLAISDPLPARLLIVEGWIGAETVRAAADEFRTGGYERAMTTGGLTGESWDERRWDYAEIAKEQLLKFGVPEEQITAAPAGAIESERTYASAVAARKGLNALGFGRGNVNVFTRGVHARRSRLVFQRAFGSKIKVGVIAWRPPGFERTTWWRFSSRSDEFLKETLGYPFELVLHSGRGLRAEED
jgi:hypothetical protein